MQCELSSILDEQDYAWIECSIFYLGTTSHSELSHHRIQGVIRPEAIPDNTISPPAFRAALLARSEEMLAYLAARLWFPSGTHFRQEFDTRFGSAIFSLDQKIFAEAPQDSIALKFDVELVKASGRVSLWFTGSR